VKGTKGTKGSRTKLNYSNIKGGQNLDLQELIKRYKPYFGYLQNLIYQSPPLEEKLNLKREKKSLYKTLRNSNLAKPYRIDLFNASSKIMELYLLVNKGEPISYELKSQSPNLKRELSLQ
jgi:hypothetical protein